MTNEYGFFSSKDHDRAYSAEDFCAFFRDFFTDGVLGGNTDELKASADSGMRVKVSPGTAYIDGRFFRPAETKHIEIKESDGTYPRKDIIVIRCDYSARKVLIDVVEGEASASPKAPEPVRSGMVYELCIAEIYVGADALEITDADITDTRFDSSLCGIVTGAIDTIDTTDLFKQYQTAWELLISGMELDEPGIIKAFEALNVTKSVNSVTPAEGNIPLSMDNIYSGKDYPKYTVQCGTISGAETTDPQKMELNVVYPKPFKSKPTVVASIVCDTYASNELVISDETAEGFTIRLQAVDHYNFNWIAVGDFVPEWEGAIPGTNLAHVEAGQMHSLTSDEIAYAFNNGGESNV